MAKSQPPIKIQPDRDRLIAPAMAVIMLVAIALRFYNLGEPSFWSDEFLTISIASGQVETINQAVREAEQTPPLLHYFMYYWIRTYGISEFAVRFPFALCGVGAVWMMYKLGGLLYTRREGAIAALLMAVSAFQISYSQEARVYAALMLVALCSCYWFVRLIQTGGLKAQIGYVLTTGLLYWIHLYAVFVVAAQMAAWIWVYFTGVGAEPNVAADGKQGASEGLHSTESKMTPLIWLTCTFLSLALFAPWMPTVVHWVRNATQAFWISPMTRWFLPQTYALYAGSAIMLVILLGLDILGVMRTRQRWKSIFLIALLTIPVLIPYIVSLVIRPLFVHRYGIATAGGLYILAARGCTALPSKPARGLMILGLLALSAINVYPDLRDGPANKPDVRSAVQYVLAAAHRGDVFLLNSYANSIFVHYLRETDTTQYRMTYEPKDIPQASSVEPATQFYALSLRGPDGKFPEGYKEIAEQRGWLFRDDREFHGVLMEHFSGK